MVNRKELKEDRKRLQEIYVTHDVTKFREFIVEHAVKDARFKPHVDDPDEKLSLLMYSMKSQLMYLGKSWQEARNVLRARQFWCREQTPATILPQLPAMPICKNCKSFREPEDTACMLRGSTPGDVCCPCYKALHKNKAN